MAVILGTGAYRYEVIDSWAKLPPGQEFNADVAAVGVDKQDNVYAFNRGAHPMVRASTATATSCAPGARASSAARTACTWRPTTRSG